MPPRLLKDLGERRFIATFLHKLKKFCSHRYIVPPGDDAVVLRNANRSVLSIDGITEGTHFDLRWQIPLKKVRLSLGRALGWKAMGSALSDLAAMGDVRHRWAMVFLSAPPHTPINFLAEIHRGIRDMAQRYDCLLAGGDTVKSPKLSLVTAVGGDLINNKPITRAGAKVGDLVCVAGNIGEAAAGFYQLTSKKMNNRKDGKIFFKRLFDHRPLFAVGKILGHFSGITSGMDLSDSLIESCQLISRESSVRIHIQLDKLPVPKKVREVLPSLSHAWGFGDDYSILFTVNKRMLKDLEKKLRFSVIGEVMPGTLSAEFFYAGKPIHGLKKFQQF